MGVARLELLVFNDLFIYHTEAQAVRRLVTTPWASVEMSGN